MKTAIIDANTSGNYVVLTGIPGKRFRIYAYMIFSESQNYFIWKSGSTALSGQMHMTAGSNAAIHLGDNWPGGGMPVLQTGSGEDLILYLNAPHGIGGHITYGEIAV